MSLSVVAAVLPAIVAGPGEKLSFDKYGGWKAVKFEPGRFFRTQFDGKRWWLVTPDGHAFLSIGSCCVQSAGSYIKGTSEYPYKDNVLKKHGSIKAWAKVARERMRKWEFNTMACWSGHAVKRAPRTEILSFGGDAGANWLTGKMPDFFSPAFKRSAKKTAEKCRRHRDNPWLIGYFLDNEMAWGRDWRNAPNLFDQYAARKASTPGKRALGRMLRDRHKTCESFNKVWSPAIKSWSELGDVKALTPRDGQARVASGDREAFVLKVARAYFRTCAESIRAVDPSHLVLGCRFVSWVAPRMAVKACGEYCDVVSINFYELGVAGQVLYNRWHKGSGHVEGKQDMSPFYDLAKKPLLITEFGFRSKDSGLPNTYPPPLAVQPLVRTQHDRGERYAKYVNMWMKQPFFVGYHWFRWMDEPKEGRFDGENGNYGLVDIKDEPYHVFIKKVTSVNRGVWALHRDGPPVKE